MEGYKKIIRSQKARLKFLRMFDFLSDAQMIRLQYRIKTGRFPNLKNPRRYTEKLLWYKLHYKDEKMIPCVDKYDVRAYVEAKGLADILNTCYDVYDRAADIDFDALPERFVLKDTLAGGGNFVRLVANKSETDLDALRRTAAEWLSLPSKTKNGGRAWQYYSGKPSRILIEQYLTDAGADDLTDYKFLCFRGRVHYIIVDKDRFTDHKRNFYDTNWNFYPVDTDHHCSPKTIEKPENLSAMIRVAEILSADFPAVRVDLYNVCGKIYFGELTFYPWDGYVRFNPDTFDYTLGNLFDLNEVGLS